MEKKVLVLNKFKPNDNFEKNKAKVKEERKNIFGEKKRKVLTETNTDSDNLPTQLVVKFVSMDGNEVQSSQNQISIPTDMSAYDLNRLMNESLMKLDEKVSYLFYINDNQIKLTVKDTLRKLKDFNSETVVNIVYCPESLFRVKPLTRGGSILEGHTDSILTVQFSPDGRILATGGGDNSVRFWDVYTDTPYNVEDSHSSWVLCLSFSPCSSKLVSGSVDGKIIVWDTSTFKMEGNPIKAHSQWVTAIAWKPIHLDQDSNKFLTTGKDGYLKIWNSVTRTCMLSIGAHEKSITKAIWSGENLIYTCSQDQTIKIFDESGNFVKVLNGHAHWINTMAINTEHILRTGAHNMEKPVEFNGDKAKMHVAAKSRYEKFKATINSTEKIVSGSDDFTLIMWDHTVSDKPIARMTGHQGIINHVAFSPNAFYVASASFDKCIKVWNGNTGAYLFNFRAHVGPVYQIAWAPNSKMLLSASKDSSLICWNIEAKKMMHNLPGHADEVYCVDWNPNGEKAASGSKDRRLRIWLN